MFGYKTAREEVDEYSGKKKGVGEQLQEGVKELEDGVDILDSGAFFLEDDVDEVEDGEQDHEADGGKEANKQRPGGRDTFASDEGIDQSTDESEEQEDVEGKEGANIMADPP